MHAPRILLLAPSHSYRCTDFLSAAATLGVELVIGSDYQALLGDRVPARSLELDLGDVTGDVARIASFAARHPLSAVLAADDQGVELAAAAGRALGLAHNDPRSVAATRDKYRLRQALRAAGLPCPDFTLVDLTGDTARDARRVRYPCVLKPRHLSGSRGVMRVDDEAGFVTACGRIAAILGAGAGAGACAELSHTALAEGFIPGREVVVEGLLRNGKLQLLALMDKPDPLDGPFFEETVLVSPSRLPRAERRAVVSMTDAAARGIGLAHGPLHAELRVNAAGAWVVEIAARPMGGLCGRSLRFRGESLEAVILRGALGLPATPVQEEHDATGVMMIPIARAGRLRAVRGVDRARRLPGIRDLVIGIGPDAPVVPLPEGDRYLGFIFATGPDPQTVVDRLRTAHATLEIDVR